MPTNAPRLPSSMNHIQDSGMPKNTAQPRPYSQHSSGTLYQVLPSGPYTESGLASDVEGSKQLMHPSYTLDPAIPDEPVEESTTSSSNLAYDFLTPEYSSEYLYSIASAQTTPSIDDRFWDETMAVDPKHTLLSSMLETSPSTGNDLPQAMETLPLAHEKRSTATAASNSLISPQLTNTPSPLEPYPTVHPSAAIDYHASTSAPKQVLDGSRRPRPGLQVKPLQTPAHSGSSSNVSLLESPLDPIARTASPIVMVSSYERGDSPARSRANFGRSSSKRSRGSRSSRLLAPDDGDSSGGEECSTLSPALNSNPPQIKRSDDGEWLATTTTGHFGVEPEMRGNEFVLSPNRTEEVRLVHEKNAEVQTWLAQSEASSEIDDDESSTRKLRRPRSKTSRLRAHSTNTLNNALGLGIVDDSNIPGPGVLVDEDSDDEVADSSSEVGSESPPAHIGADSPQSGNSEFPPLDESPAEAQEPLPRQFFRASPWQDPVLSDVPISAKHQPSSSNAAIAKYDQQAAIFETASRAATWGTRRRLSEADVNSIIGDASKLQQLSLTSSKSREHRTSFIDKARGLVPKRSSSNVKKKAAEANTDAARAETGHKRRGESVGSIKPVQRVPSFSRSKKSPPLDTGSALMAIAGQLAAVGRSTPTTPLSAGTHSGPWNILKRQRSKSDLPKVPGKLSPKRGLAERMSHYGGAPMPTLASPMQERPTAEKRSDDDEEGEEDEDGLSNGDGVKMDFKVRVDNIIPTLEGFKTHANQLNPRIQHFLVGRIGQEQVRRYKKLAENKVKHAQAVHGAKKCSSGKHCVELGGEATLLPPRTSAKDPETVYAQFQIAGNGESDDDGMLFTDGVINAALFPPGIPLPPVKRLPAEFECSLCFKVKKFQKPSDWTKHVHEDIQPFTCTFAHCAEPKSFKRKADWVRHENERHRHLEWWRCNIPDCHHVCYRKDNFVQHLVREHKKAEPKVKSRGSGSSKAKPIYEDASLPSWRTRVQQQQQEEEEEPDEVWQLVDSCRCETKQKPTDEVCKFCGNVCNSWKKLTVHLAKHMEQIAMPVLELVRQREVSPDTIISPVEQGSQRPYNTPLSPHTTMKVEPHSLSPYSMDGALGYPSVSTSHSPVDTQEYYQPSQGPDQHQFHVDQTFHGQALFQPTEMTKFARIHGLPDNMSYGPYQGALQPHLFKTTASGTPVTYPPPYNAVRREALHVSPHIPRSHPVQQGLESLSMNSLPRPEYIQQQAPNMYSSPTETLNYHAQFDSHISPSQPLSQFPLASNPDEDGTQAAVSMPQDQIYEVRPAMIYAHMQPQGHDYLYQQ